MQNWWGSARVFSELHSNSVWKFTIRKDVWLVVYELNTVFFFGFLSSSLKRETFFYVNTVVKSIKQWRRWCHSGNTHPPDSLGKVSTPLSFYATLQFHFPQYFSFFERFNQITENNSLFKTPQQEQCVKGTLSWVSISFDIVIYGL